MESTVSVKVPDLEPGWREALAEEFSKDYMFELKSFLVEEMKAAPVYPPANLIFNAFQLTPLEKIKIVILGQDPYHGPGQAHGLCFSVPHGIQPPPSLINIYKEINQDLGIPIPNHGCLEHWAKQGVLLLNTSLTVRAHQPQSHSGKGWEIFTDRVIAEINERRAGVIFILWGSSARKKKDMIDKGRHWVLEAPHPSPLSANRGFFGCKHFSRANWILEEQGDAPIDWGLPN